MGKLKKSQEMIPNAHDMVKKLKSEYDLSNFDFHEDEVKITTRYSLYVNKFLFLYLNNYEERVTISSDEDGLPKFIHIRKEE
jgi:hypothetical protein